jgi:hypothetical protein
MNFKTVKTIIKVIILCAGGVASLSAEAIQVAGTLGTSSVVVDAWIFPCPSGTTQARIRVFDINTINNSAATVFATFGKDGNPTLTVSDTESTPTSSPWATNTADGAGNYALVVRRSGSGAEDYVIDGECLNSLSQIIGPPRITLQINQ